MEGCKSARAEPNSFELCRAKTGSDEVQGQTGQMAHIRGHLAHAGSTWWEYRCVAGHESLAPQDDAQEVQIWTSTHFDSTDSLAFPLFMYDDYIRRLLLSFMIISDEVERWHGNGNIAVRAVAMRPRCMKDEGCFVNRLRPSRVLNAIPSRTSWWVVS